MERLPFDLKKSTPFKVFKDERALPVHNHKVHKKVTLNVSVSTRHLEHTQMLVQARAGVRDGNGEGNSDWCPLLLQRGRRQSYGGPASQIIWEALR
jgi:hypothetical protein